MKSIFKIQLRGRHREILQMIRAHQYKFVGSLLCSILISLTAIAMAYLIEPVVDEIFIEKNLEMIALVPICLLYTSDAADDSIRV